MKKLTLIILGIFLSGAIAYAQTDASEEENVEESCDDLPPAEVSFLKALRERQRELQEREARVAQREEELRKRESEFRKRIADAIGRLEKLESIAEAGEKGREARDARVMPLAQAIESLSPK